MNAQDLSSLFPLFQHARAGGSPFYYLDSAATTQKPLPVLEALQKFYTTQNANAHRGVYGLAWKATQAYDAARQTVQRFLNAAHAEEIIFTKGATEGINLVAESFLPTRLTPDDEVLVSAMEHHANLLPWQRACQHAGARLRILPIRPNGELCLEQLPELLSERTKLFALTHISNTLGTLNPVARAIAEAHRHNVPVLLDAAQSAACLPLDVQALNCDFLVFSGHKVYGPMGIGVLYGKKKWLDACAPYQVGGGMVRSVTFEQATYSALPQRLEAGTPNIAGAVGLAAALQWLEGIGREAVWVHQQQLTAYTHAALHTVEGLRLIGTAEQRGGIFSFVLEGIHPHDVATFLDSHGFAVRAGHHCTQPLMTFYQLPATVRVSLGIYNHSTEIDALVQALRATKAFFGTC